MKLTKYLFASLLTLNVTNANAYDWEYWDSKFYKADITNGFNGSASKTDYYQGFYFRSHLNGECKNLDGPICSRNELRFHKPEVSSGTADYAKTIDTRFTLNLEKLSKLDSGVYPSVIVWQTYSKMTPVGNLPQAALTLADNGNGGLSLKMRVNNYLPGAQDKNDYSPIDPITIISDFKFNTDYPIIVRLHPGVDQQTGFMDVFYNGGYWISPYLYTYNTAHGGGQNTNIGQYWTYGYNLSNLRTKEIKTHMKNFTQFLTSPW